MTVTVNDYTKQARVSPASLLWTNSTLKKTKTKMKRIKMVESKPIQAKTKRKKLKW